MSETKMVLLRLTAEEVKILDEIAQSIFGSRNAAVRYILRTTQEKHNGAAQAITGNGGAAAVSLRA